MIALLMMLQAQAPTQHYRFEGNTDIAMDLSAMGQGTQNQRVHVVAYLGLQMHDSAGRRARMTIDSLNVDAGQLSAMMPPELIDSAKGITIDAEIVDGRVKGTPTVSRPNVAAAQIMGALGLFFPGTHAGLKVGDNWSDTVAVDTATAVGTVGNHTVSNWKVSSLSNGSATLTGTSTGTTSLGGMMQMEMAMNGTMEIVTPIGGPARSATMTQTSKQNMNIMGQSIPMSMTMVSSLTSVP